MKASLSSLSQELIDLVVEYLIEQHDCIEPHWRRPQDSHGKPCISQYATISRTFQYAVERYLFRDLVIHTEETLRVTANRVQSLKSIDFWVYFPLDIDATTDGELRAEDQTAIDERNIGFSTQIQNMFQILRALDHDSLPPLDLHVDIGLFESQQNFWGPRESNDWMKYSMLRDKFGASIEDVLFARSYLRLLNHENLPIIYRTSELQVSTGSKRVEGAAIVNIAKKFRSLVKLEVPFGDIADGFPRERQDRRLRFADALTTLPYDLPNLKELQFRPTTISKFDRRYLHWDPPRAVPAGSEDSLSVVINHISQRLVKLEISSECIISPSLFWPDHGPKPYWPFLEEVTINIHGMTPEGELRYRAIPPRNALESQALEVGQRKQEQSYYTDEDDPIIRKVKDFARRSGRLPGLLLPQQAIQEKVAPIFLAATMAATRMPKLQIMDVSSCACGRSYWKIVRMVFIERGTMLPLLMNRTWRPALLENCPKWVAPIPAVHWLQRGGLDTGDIDDLWRNMMNRNGTVEIVDNYDLPEQEHHEAVFKWYLERTRAELQ